MFLFFVILTVFNVCIVGINSADPPGAKDTTFIPYDLSQDGLGKSLWTDNCLTPGQSPINIVDPAVMEFPYPAVLNIEMHSVLPESITVKRESTNIDFKLKYPNNQQPTLSGGPLGTDIYILEKLHFHWTETCGGSEHAINYIKYATEAHLVYYNSKYGSFAASANVPNNDGFAVIAVMIELVIDDDRKESEIAKMIKRFNILKADASSNLILLPDEKKNLLKISDIIQNKYFSYYGYKGGFTSPPCTKGVTWIISRDTLKLTAADISVIKKMKAGDGDKNPILKNSRSLQKLEDRTVYLFSNI